MDNRLLTINLIKSQISQSKVDFENASFDKLYEFCCDHSVANIVGKALFELGLAEKSENKDEFYAQQLSSLLDYQRQQYDLDRIKTYFENEKICYVALKGAVIRGFYPEPEMRTSCDIDILVKKEDMERAQKCLINNMGAEFMCQTAHDISYMTDSGVHIELHHTLCEDSYPASNVLKKAWDYASGEAYEKYFTNEFFLYYHYAHMVKHFVDGGFGIRLIVDLYLINKNMHFDYELLDKLLDMGGIKTFAKTCDELSLAWFEDKAHTEATEILEKYIFDSGIFGTLVHGVAIRKATQGTGGSFLKRLFLPKDILAEQYPKLKKHPYLYMWYFFVRVFKSGFSKTTTEIRLMGSIDDKTTNEINKMLDALDINIKE